MNKSDMIDHIAGSADLSKAAAARALDAVIGGVTTTLQHGNEVALTGFGTFVAVDRAERLGRNPRTGESIQIKAAKTLKFRPGKILKEALN